MTLRERGAPERVAVSSDEDGLALLDTRQDLLLAVQHLAAMLRQCEAKAH